MPTIRIHNDSCTTTLTLTEAKNFHSTINLVAWLQKNMPDVPEYSEALKSLHSVLDYWKSNDGDSVTLPKLKTIEG